MDISIDDEILAERVINDLIRNIQFTRKKNGFNVGEEILIKIGTNVEHLREYLKETREKVTEKINAKTFEILTDKITEEKDLVFGKLNICPNRECTATLKENIIAKLQKKSKVQCPYCKIELQKESINSITFSFKKTYVRILMVE